jgi:hypothetical protein
MSPASDPDDEEGDGFRVFGRVDLADLLEASPTMAHACHRPDTGADPGMGWCSPAGHSFLPQGPVSCSPQVPQPDPFLAWSPSGFLA